MSSRSVVVGAGGVGEEGAVDGFGELSFERSEGFAAAVAGVASALVVVAAGAGYRLTHTWLASFGQITAVTVESTGSFGAALTRSLLERGCGVIEINQPHLYLRSRRGKNDAIDAEAAARKVLSGEAGAPAVTGSTSPATAQPTEPCT